MDFNGRNSGIIVENLESFTPFNFTLIMEVQFNVLGSKRGEARDPGAFSMQNIKNNSFQNLSLSSSKTETKEKNNYFQNIANEQKFRSDNKQPIMQTLIEEKSLSFDEEQSSPNLITISGVNGAQLDIYIDCSKRNSLVIDLFVPKKNSHIKEIFEFEFQEKTLYHIMITSCKDKERENKGTVKSFCILLKKKIKKLMIFY